MPEYPVIEYSKKHLLLAKQFLRSVRTSTSINNFALVYQAGEVEEFPRQACYGQLSYDDREGNPIAPNNPCVLFCDKVGNITRALSDDLLKTYLSWLLNESVFRHAYITKKWNLVAKFGCLFSTQYPLPYVVQAGKAIRYCVEYPHIVQLWGKLSPHMNKDAALFLAHFIKEDREDCFAGYDGYISGHNLFDKTEFGCRGLQRVVEGDLTAFTGRSMAQQTHGYMGQGKLWGKREGREEYRAIVLPPDIAKTIERQDLFGQPIKLTVFRWKDLPQTGERIVQFNLERLGDAA